MVMLRAVGSVRAEAPWANTPSTHIRQGVCIRCGGRTSRQYRTRGTDPARRAGFGTGIPKASMCKDCREVDPTFLRYKRKSA